MKLRKKYKEEEKNRGQDDRIVKWRSIKRKKKIEDRRMKL